MPTKSTRIVWLLKNWNIFALLDANEKFQLKLGKILLFEYSIVMLVEPFQRISIIFVMIVWVIKRVKIFMIQEGLQ